MSTYISILRGINVGGQKLIKMDALRKSYESSDFRDVTTYVQSGNVIFSAEKADIASIERKISQRIKEDFGFDVPVFVLSVDKLQMIISANPLLKDAEKDRAFMHATFLSSKPGKVDYRNIEEKKQAGEAIAFSDSVVYLYCPNGYGRTKLNNTFLESKLQVSATTRNWKTTMELMRLAGLVNKNG